jgi:hypothetical protein
MTGGGQPGSFLDFQVNPSDLPRRRIVELPSRPLEQGQARFRAGSSALTANISHASTGSFLGYQQSGRMAHHVCSNRHDQGAAEVASLAGGATS